MTLAASLGSETKSAGPGGARDHAQRGVECISAA